MRHIQPVEIPDMGFVRRNIIKYLGKIRQDTSDDIVVEAFYTLCLNGKEHTTFPASPMNIHELVVGLLFGEGIISCREDILEYKNKKSESRIFVQVAKNTKDFSRKKRVLLTGCGAITSPSYLNKIESILPLELSCSIKGEFICKTISEFSMMSKLYSSTGGVHSAALVSEGGVVCFFEDISRHNAVDKIIGHSILNNTKTDSKWLASSGRISSDLIFKLARARIPMAVSRNAPTSTALDLAEIFNITVLGFTRGSRFNIYTCPQRIS